MPVSEPPVLSKALPISAALTHLTSPAAVQTSVAPCGWSQGDATAAMQEKANHSKTQRAKRRLGWRIEPGTYCADMAAIIKQAGILAAMRSLFHFAFNVTNLDLARRFYGDILGCDEGRSTASWVDFDFFGHQLSLHLGEPFKTQRTGHVGEHLVPMPHFGLVLALEDWQAMAARLRDANIGFVLEPQVRFEGQSGEQWTMFFLDPFGNPIEVKGFRSLDSVYAAQ